MAEVMTETNVNETEVVENTEVINQEQNESQASNISETSEPKKSIEDMLSELMAENAKLKREKDKASSEAANYKRQVMASKSQSEQEAIEKAEAAAKIQEELAELRKESALNKLEKSFVALGYSEEMAKQAAEAQYEGNTELLFQIQKKFFSEKEKTIKSQLMKTMPAPSIGNGETISVTKEEFAAMDYKQRVDLFNKYPKVYEELTTK